MAKSGLRFIAVAFTVLVLTSASIPFIEDEKAPTFNIAIEKMDDFNNYYSPATVKDFRSHGFSLWSIVKVDLPDGRSFNAYLGERLDGILPLETFVVTKDTGTSIGVFNLDVNKSLKIQVGWTLKITQIERMDMDKRCPHYSQGYAQQRPGQTDVDFANFGTISGGELRENIYYRSTAYETKNVNNRANIIERLYSENGIQKEVYLADDKNAVDKYFSKTTGHPYLEYLYGTGSIITIEMGINNYLQFDQYRDTLLHIADNDDSAVVTHCSVGKDRTGFIAAMMLAIANASDEAIHDAIMDSYIKLYGVEKGSDEYCILEQRFFTNAMFIMNDVTVLDHYLEFDWSSIVIESGFGDIVRKYVKVHILDYDEYVHVYESLTGKTYVE